MIDKSPVFRWMLDTGDLLITIDTAIDGVDVPMQLRDQRLVNFILGYKPTPKMVFDEWGISAAMRFSAKLFTCRFPWESIRAISSDVAVIQFRNSPNELTDEKNSAGAESLPLPTKGENEEKKERAHLRIIK